MNLRLDFTPEFERLLRFSADQQGLTPEGLVQTLLEAALSPKSEGATGVLTGADPTEIASHANAASEEEAAPWRGVFLTEHVHKPLFRQNLTTPIADLPRRQPNVVINPCWLNDEE